MPSQKFRTRRRRRGLAILISLIVLLAIIAVALTMILLNSKPLSGTERVQSAPISDNEGFVDQRDATIAPLVLGASPTPESPEPTPGPETNAPPMEEALPEEAPLETEAAETVQSESQRLTPTARPGDYFLPIYDRALRTPNDENMIAVTIDDCNKAEAMSQVLNIAKRYKARFTLFPTGEALMTPGMTQGFRTCVRSMGFELENHSYAHKQEYKLTNGELALQLWKQSIAASYAMDGDYQQHFYRPYSNYSVGDQRTHFYIRKLGYLGIAGYTHSYKDFDDAEALIRTLENGKVYQFDMSDKSMSLLEAFVSEASRKGYKLVTMNKLFGLEENSLSSQLTIDRQTLPELNDYVPSYYDLKLNDRTNAVFTLQTQLIQLGYLTAEGEEKLKADGIYGPSTSVAVSVFQAESGIPATGNATIKTQEALAAAVGSADSH